MKNNTEIKRFIFFTDEAFLIYFGRNYESTVLQANRRCIPVIRIINANGTRSALPLERANSLLEKYYRLRDKQVQEVYHAQLNEMAPVTDYPMEHQSPEYYPEPVAEPIAEKTLISGAA